MDKLYSVCWNITGKCNENCQFCFRRISKDNTIDENIKIINNLLQIHTDKISFCGGEPLLYPYLFDLANHIKFKSPHTKLSLTTNGKLIDNEILEKILSTFDNISLSIDSSSANINEDIGRGYNHLDKMIEVLNKANDLINIKINTVATKINMDDLTNIYNLIKAYNISRWKIFRFYPLRRGSYFKEKFYLNDDESCELEKQIDRIKELAPFDISYNNYNEFTTSYFNIYSDGSVENNKEEVVGNLLDQSIYEIIDIKKRDLSNHYLRKHI